MENKDDDIKNYSQPARLIDQLLLLFFENYAEQINAIEISDYDTMDAEFEAILDRYMFSLGHNRIIHMMKNSRDLSKANFMGFPYSFEMYKNVDKNKFMKMMNMMKDVANTNTSESKEIENVLQSQLELYNEYAEKVLTNLTHFFDILVSRFLTSEIHQDILQAKFAGIIRNGFTTENSDVIIKEQIIKNLENDEKGEFSQWAQNFEDEMPQNPVNNIFSQDSVVPADQGTFQDVEDSDGNDEKETDIKSGSS